MKFYLLTNKIMTKKSGILTAIAVATAISTAPASAETHNQIEQQKIEQKVGQVTCATKLACEVLSHSIQAQIDDLKEKGLRNLTKEERVKFGSLKKELIAIKDSNIEIEQKETEQNADLIASKDAEITKENNKQSEQEKLIAIEKAETKARLTKVEERLSSIEGSL